MASNRRNPDDFERVARDPSRRAAGKRSDAACRALHGCYGCSSAANKCGASDGAATTARSHGCFALLSTSRESSSKSNHFAFGVFSERRRNFLICEGETPYSCQDSRSDSRVSARQALWEHSPANAEYFSQYRAQYINGQLHTEDHSRVVRAGRSNVSGSELGRIVCV